MSSMFQALVRVGDTMVNEINMVSVLCPGGRQRQVDEHWHREGICRMLWEHVVGSSRLDIVAGCGGGDGENLLEKLFWGAWQPWNRALGFPLKKELAVQLLGIQLSDTTNFQAEAMLFQEKETASYPLHATVHGVEWMVVRKREERGKGGIVLRSWRVLEGMMRMLASTQSRWDARRALGGQWYELTYVYGILSLWLCSSLLSPLWAIIPTPARIWYLAKQYTFWVTSSLMALCGESSKEVEDFISDFKNVTFPRMILSVFLCPKVVEVIKHQGQDIWWSKVQSLLGDQWNDCVLFLLFCFVF